MKQMRWKKKKKLEEKKKNRSNQPWVCTNNRKNTKVACQNDVSSQENISNLKDSKDKLFFLFPIFSYPDIKQKGS